MFGAALTISGSWSDHLSRNELEHETMELSTDIEDFEAFEDGTYFAIYNHNKKLEKGSLPREFDENAPFESGKLSKYSSSQSEFYYFDVYNAKERKWIRGIRSASGLSKELSLSGNQTYSGFTQLSRQYSGTACRKNPHSGTAYPG